MEKSSCREILEAHCNSARMRQEVTKKYLEVFEQKWDKILECLQGENAYRYVFLPSGLPLWLILGRTDEYLLLPPFYCSCHDFYFNAVSKKKEICCYHIITQIICQRSDRFTTIYKDDSLYREYLDDLLERD